MMHHSYTLTSLSHAFWLHVALWDIDETTTAKKRGDEMPHWYLANECSVQQCHAKTAIHNRTRSFCPLTNNILVPTASQVMCSTCWVSCVLTVKKGFQGSNGTKLRPRLLGNLGLVVLFPHQSATVCSHTSKHPLFFGIMSVNNPGVKAPYVWSNIFSGWLVTVASSWGTQPEGDGGNQNPSQSRQSPAGQSSKWVCASLYCKTTK